MDFSPRRASSRRLSQYRELRTGWILLLLDSGASHGYELRRVLEARGLSIDSAVLYRTLGQLERDGCVESRWMRPRQGPRRRLYRLTAAGRRALDDLVDVVSDVRDLHDAFVQQARTRSARRAS